MTVTLERVNETGGETASLSAVSKPIIFILTRHCSFTAADPCSMHECVNPFQNCHVMRSYKNRATYYRAALLLGLVSVAEVVAWSDEVIAENSAIDPAFLEISSIISGDATDVTALRYALFPLCCEKEPSQVIEAILCRIGADFFSARRSIQHILTVLMQVRSLLHVPKPIAEQLKLIEVNFGLHPDTITEHEASVTTALTELFTPFDKADQRILGKQ